MDRVAKKRRKTVLGVVAVATVVAALAPTAYNYLSTLPIITSVEDAPAAPVALVLGAQVYPNGNPSPYLRGRLEKAAELYRHGKVKVILVSGDNGTKFYNEPDAMRRWLIEQGIPQQHVIADYAGFDTYDSCVRAKKIFGINKMIVVTQTYHLYRAVATAKAIGIQATGVGDETARGDGRTWRYGQLREMLASWKMVVDLVIQRTPTLGEKETSIEEALRNR